MRKITYLLMVMIFTIALVSCKPTDEGPIDLELSVINYTIIEQVIDVHVIVPIEITDVEDLLDIALHMASITYDQHFDEIGTASYELNIRLYASSSDYTSGNATYGYHQFLINQSISSPGLSLGTNGLKLN